MDDQDFRQLMEQGDAAGVREALESNPDLANRTIRWHLNQDNESDPLHYVSECVAQGWLVNGAEAGITRLLLEHGPRIEGSDGRESPLLGSASLGAEAVSRVLIEGGASLEATALFGARALHWAAWLGSEATVACLIAHGAEIEPRCTEFGATPLFWAVHGFGPNGPRQKRDQIGAAQRLIEAGAAVHTANRQGRSALDLAKLFPSRAMYEMLSERA